MSAPRMRPPGRSPHDREIARLAVPALGALVAEPLYVLADTAVVGRLGTEHLAGLAVASAALLSGYAVFIFLAYGTTAAVSRLLGAGQPQLAARQGIQGLWLATGIGLVVAAGVFVGTDGIVGALGADGAVHGHASVYLRISALGIPAQLMVFAGTGYLRGVQDTRTPLAVAVAAAVANLVVELVLINGLGFGIGASAASTVLAQFGSAAALLAIVVRTSRSNGVSMAPDLAAIGALARVGGDLFVRTLALRAALSLSTAVAARVGTVDVAAHEIAWAVWSLLALTLDAVAIAGQAMIGRHLGAGDVEAARSSGRRMLELGTMGGVATMLVVLTGRWWIPHAFTTDEQVAALAAFVLVWVAVLQPVSGAVFVLDGLLIGAGDMRFLAGAMVAALLCMAPVAGAVIVFDLGIGWVWGSIAVLMGARLVVLGRRWAAGSWAVTGLGGT